MVTKCLARFLVLIVSTDVFQCMGQTLSKVKSNPYNSSSTTTISVTPHRTEPTGTTASQHQVNEYTATNGSDTVCIVLVASLEFHIKYNAINAIQTANVTIPANYSTSGNCSYDNNQQRLNIYFFNNMWNFSVVVKKDSKNTAENLENKTMQYYWSEIDLNYIVTEQLFPGVIPEFIDEKVKIATFFPAGLFHTSGASYRCNSTKIINLGESNIEISLFLYRAFGTSSDDDFSNTGITDCTYSPNMPVKKVDKTPAIVIGAICAGLGVIGVIVYILFRQRLHKRYQNM